jgi:hypothetical protein
MPTNTVDLVLSRGFVVGQRAVGRHRLGPALVAAELVPVGVVDADVGLLGVLPGVLDAGLGARRLASSRLPAMTRAIASSCPHRA